MLARIKSHLRKLADRLRPVPPVAISRNGVTMHPGMSIRLPGGEGTHAVHHIIDRDLIEVRYSDGVIDSAPSRQWNVVRSKRR